MKNQYLNEKLSVLACFPLAAICFSDAFRIMDLK